MLLFSPCSGGGMLPGSIPPLGKIWWFWRQHPPPEKFFLKSSTPPPSKCFFYLVGAHRKLKKAFWGGGNAAYQKKFFRGGGCCLQNHQILPRGGCLQAASPPLEQGLKSSIPPLRQGGGCCFGQKVRSQFWEFFFNWSEIDFLLRFLKMSPEFPKINIVNFPKHLWILFLPQF